jgi:hypothetical protein
MKKYLLCFLLIAFNIESLTAQKYNYQWPYGYGSNLALDFGFSKIDFNNQQVTISAIGELDHFDFGYNGSFICDKDGQLQLMTNNCAIRDKNFNIIEQGDTLTPGITWDNYCADNGGYYGDYPASQANLFLPELSNDSVYYLLHKDANISNFYQDVISQNFYLSIIVKRENGFFYLKEKKKIKEGVMSPRKLTACRSTDGTKWWTYVIDYNSNKFYSFEIGGIELIGTPVLSTLGIAIDNDETAGQATFSPNTKILAINSNRNNGVLLYDFDNATGVFSNFRKHIYTDLSSFAEGTAFSPNNRYLYLTIGRHIYQMDLEVTNPSDEVYDMGEVSFQDETGWPVGVGFMYLGSDCRIYVGPGSTTYYIHVIHNPNEKGFNCNFEVKAIRSPTNLQFELPNTINYHPQGLCDSTIAWGIPVKTTEIAAPLDKIKLYPNPADEVVIVSLLALAQHSKITVVDVYGNVIESLGVFVGQSEVRLSTINYPVGIYFIHLNGSNNIAKLIIAR